jgi:hypothetical protein
VINALREHLREFRLGIEPGADRGAALRERIKFGQDCLQPRNAGFHLRGVTRKLLAERERRRILRMRAPDLHDLREFLLFPVQRAIQMRQRGDQPSHDLFRRRDMHRGRERIVRRLAHIDVVIGVHRRFRAELAAEHLDRTVRDHLVDVHIRLCAASGLPDP